MIKFIELYNNLRNEMTVIESLLNKSDILSSSLTEEEYNDTIKGRCHLCLAIMHGYINKYDREISESDESEA